MPKLLIYYYIYGTWNLFENKNAWRNYLAAARARTFGCHFYCGCGGGVLVHLYLYTFCLYLIQGGDDENLLNNKTLFLITLGNKIVFFCRTFDVEHYGIFCLEHASEGT